MHWLGCCDKDQGSVALTRFRGWWVDCGNSPAFPPPVPHCVRHWALGMQLRCTAKQQDRPHWLQVLLPPTHVPGRGVRALVRENQHLSLEFSKSKRKANNIQNIKINVFWNGTDTGRLAHCPMMADTRKQGDWLTGPQELTLEQKLLRYFEAYPSRDLHRPAANHHTVALRLEASRQLALLGGAVQILRHLSRRAPLVVLRRARASCLREVAHGARGQLHERFARDASAGISTLYRPQRQALVAGTLPHRRLLHGARGRAFLLARHGPHARVGRPCKPTCPKAARSYQIYICKTCAEKQNRYLETV